ncbi:Mitochondria fission 1 protein [Elsinoe australis]|uniref:Mitochondria fission 1 protein n=1 Tax=Elsinoe australis TaxID=40998 RepID=A0A2P7YC30_9PEZI|nr:Mitochondria fission 1 protein [Elsinoe australis]
MSGIPNPLSGMTFQSGWDSCMARSYCKWPVIVGIVIGSLIVISVVWCVVKILCCGAQCCFCCASITKCLCCRCCSSGGSSRPPRDQYVSPLAHGNPYGSQKSGYVNPAAYESGFGNHSNIGTYSGGPGYAGQGQYRSQAPPKYATATFEEPSKKSNVNGDALPAMPSWNDARATRVEETSPERPGEDVEMGHLNNSGTLPKFESDDYRRGDSAHGEGYGAGTAAAVGAGAGAAAGADAYGYTRQNSYGAGVGSGTGVGAAGTGYGRPQQAQAPHNPYGQRDAYGSSTDVYGQQNMQNSPYGQAQNTASPYGQPSQNYSQTSYGVEQNPYGYHNNQSQGNTSPTHNAYSAPAQTQPRSPQHGYAAFNPPQQRTQSPAYSAYPGQSTYQSADTLPAQSTGGGYHSPTHGAPERKPVQGSWKDL